MTTLTDQPARVEEHPAGMPGSRTRLYVLIAILAMAVVALGAWVIYDATRDSGSPMTAEIEQVIDDYLLAWEEADSSAIRAAVTDDYVLSEDIYEAGSDGVSLVDRVNDDIDGVVNMGFLFEWQTERVGDTVVVGDGPWFVSIGENWVTPKGWMFTHFDGAADYVIVDEGGTLKIANHAWVGLRYDVEE